MPQRNSCEPVGARVVGVASGTNRLTLKRPDLSYASAIGSANYSGPRSKYENSSLRYRAEPRASCCTIVFTECELLLWTGYVTFIWNTAGLSEKSDETQGSKIYNCSWRWLSGYGRHPHDWRLWNEPTVILRGRSNST